MIKVAYRNIPLLTKIVWFLWAATIVFAWWFIPPRVDDGTYLFPAISVLNNYPPAGIINDSIQPIFYIFPVQPLLHGIFLKLLSFVSIEIGINSYRVFNYSLVIFLFFLIHKLFSAVFKNPIHSINASNASLIILGFSQFSTQFFVNRPEILGLVFFLMGLICSVKFINEEKNSHMHLAIASFSYGMSIVVHANFIILSGSMILYLTWRMIVDHRVRLLKFLPIFFIPSAFLLIWIFINFEVSQDQLFGRAGQSTNEGILDLTALVQMISVILGNSGNSFAHKIYLSIHMITLSLAILFLVGCFVLKNRSYREDNKIVNLFRTLSLAILVLFCLMESWPPNYLLIAFLSIISVVFYLTNLSFDKSSVIVSNYFKYIVKKFHSTIFLCIVSSLFILSLPLFHLLKVYAYDGYYYNHHTAIERLNNVMSGNEQIFINSTQLLPLYSSAINKNFANEADVNKHNIHWYFPVFSHAPGLKSQELMRKTIINDLALMQEAVWGVEKEFFYFNEDSDLACLVLTGGKHYIKIRGVKVLHEDRDNLFFVSKSAKLSNKISCFDLIIY
jgi:hypothetical protein